MAHLGRASLTLELTAAGLTPHGSYGASIDTSGADGRGINEGLGDQQADQHGRIVFNLSPALFAAIGRTAAPMSVRVWVRPGGSEQDADPVGPSYQLELTVP